MSFAPASVVVVAVTMLAAGVAGPARAQDGAALKADMIGQWELSTAEKSSACVVTFADSAAPPGMKLDLEPACAAALPFTADIVAWTVAGLDIVRLQNAAGGSVIDFTEVENGILEGRRVGEGIYILQTLAAARSIARTLDQMIGDWSMRRDDGTVICGLTLTNTVVTPDVFEVYLKPQCAPPVANFAPTTWRLDNGEIVLMSARDNWRFGITDSGQWRRVPEGAEPLILVRE